MIKTLQAKSHACLAADRGTVLFPMSETVHNFHGFDGIGG